MLKSKFASHKYYDAKSMRIRLPINEIMALPIKIVSDEEFNKIIESWEFNPNFIIGDIGKFVVGHDLNFRYQLKGDLCKTD